MMVAAVEAANVGDHGDGSTLGDGARDGTRLAAIDEAIRSVAVSAPVTSTEDGAGDDTIH